MRVALLVTHIRAEEKLILWPPSTSRDISPDIILDRELNFRYFAGKPSNWRLPASPGAPTT